MIRTTNNTISLQFFAAAALMLANSTSAELMVYEGFEYESGQIAEKAGGKGWEGAWRDAHQRVEGGESLESAIGDTPAAKGGHLTTPNGDWPAKRTLATPFAQKPGIYWIGLLATNLSAAQEETYAHFRLLPKEENAPRAVGLTKDLNSPNWSLHAGGKTQRTQSPASADPVFVVIRLTIREGEASSSAAIFMDPDVGNEPITPDVEIAGINLGPLAKLSVRSGTGAKPFAFDEVRLGTSYAAVAPKP